MTTEADKLSPSEFIRSRPADEKPLQVEQAALAAGVRPFNRSLVSQVRKAMENEKKGLGWNGQRIVKRAKVATKKPPSATMRPSDFIRSLPYDMSVDDVVAAAAKAGIRKFTPNLVRMARRTRGHAGRSGPFDVREFILGRPQMSPADIVRDAKVNWGKTIDVKRVYSTRGDAKSGRAHRGRLFNGHAPRVAREAPESARRQGPATQLDKLRKRADDYEAKAAAIRLTIRIMEEDH